MKNLRIIGLILLSFALLLSFTSAALAKEEGESLENLMALDLEDILNTTVTVATRTETTVKKVPAAISVVTAEEIAKMPYYDVWDLLRSLPGIHVAELSGNVIAVGIRGFNDKHSNKVQVLLDGRSIFNPLTQGVYWGDQPIMTEDIERIEVMRGPNSVLFGFNSFNGIINIVTKDAKDTQGAMLKTIIGSNQERQHFARWGDSVENIDYRISYQKDVSRGGGDAGGDRGNDGHGFDGERVQSYNLRTRYTVNDDINIEFFAGGKKGDRGGAPLTQDVLTTLNTDFEMIKYNQTLSEDSSLTLQLSRNLWDINKDTTSGVHDNQVLQHDIGFQHIFKPLNLEDHSFVWGGNWRRNQGRSSVFADPSRDVHDTILHVFAQDTWTITDKLTMYNGVSWEQNNFTGSDWSFRNTFMYNTYKDHYLRLTAAHAHHAHGLIEYFFAFPLTGFTGNLINGNPGLESEDITSFELGYRGSGLKKKLIYDVEVFINDVDEIRQSTLPTLNFFPTQNINPSATFNNNNRAKAWGVETSFEYLPYKWLKTYVNHSFLNLDDKTDFYNNSDPQHMANWGFRLMAEKDDNRKLLPDYLDFRARYVGPLDIVDKTNATSATGYTKYKTPQYKNIDVKIGKRILDDSTEIAFIGQNLINPDHFEFDDAINGGTQSNRLFLFTVTSEF